MKIAVIGASGMVGSRVVAELTRRGHDVTAITRSGTEVPGATSRRGDLGDAELIRSLAGDHDAILSATGPSRTGEDHQIWLDALQTAEQHAAGTRLFVVGGAGSLLVDGGRLVDQPGFPEGYKAEALTASQALDTIRQQAPESLDWVFLSPAPEIAPGERTGSYRTADDSPAGDRISAEDFAVAIADELEQPKHRRVRFTVAN